MTRAGLPESDHLDSFRRELDSWAVAGLRATLWWRDDDAVVWTPAFDRLVQVAATNKVPVTVAVIPEPLSSVADGAPVPLGPLRSHPSVTYVQHGFAHCNHAPEAAKKCEFGATRSPEALRHDIVAGWSLLQTHLPSALPVFVPPWNRMSPELPRILSETGFHGVSTFQPRSARAPAPGVTQVNTHADLMRWKPGRAFAGAPAVLDALTSHLAARRLGKADRDEPTGLLTHHLVHDADAWLFLSALISLTRRHEAVVWCSCAEVFAEGPVAEGELSSE